MLSIECENGHRLTAPEHYAGKSSRCPKCGSTVTFPATEVTATADVAEEEIDDILSQVEELQRQEKAELASQRQKRKVEARENKQAETSRPSAVKTAIPRMWLIATSLLGGCLLIAVLAIGFMMRPNGPKSNTEPVAQNASPSTSANSPTPVTAVNEASAAKPQLAEGKVIKLPQQIFPRAFEPTSGRLLAVSLNGEADEWSLYLPAYFDGDESACRKIDFPEPIRAMGFKTWNGKGYLVACTAPIRSKAGDRSAGKPIQSPAFPFQPPGTPQNGSQSRAPNSVPSIPQQSLGAKAMSVNPALFGGIPSQFGSANSEPSKPEDGTPARMLLLDSESLEVVPDQPDLATSVSLEFAEPTSISTSPSDDPQILVSAGAAFFIDLRDGSKSKYPFGDAKLSRSGRYVLTKNARILRTNRFLLTSGEGDLQTTGGGEMYDYVDPFDQICLGAGPGVQPGLRQLTSLRPSTIPFPNGVFFRGFMQELPWLVADDMKQIHWLSRETGQIVASVPSPMEHVNSIFDDVGRRRLLLFGPTTAAVVPYSDIGFPKSDALVATIHLPERIEPGQRLSIPFVSPTPDLKVSLLEGPSSAKITNGRLEWVPTDDDIGSVQLKIRYELGVDVKDDVIECAVSRLPVRLPFEPREFRMGTDGSYVVVWNSLPSQFGGKPEPPRVAVYDLESRQVAAVTNWEHDIYDVAVSEKYVAVLSRGEWSNQTALDFSANQSPAELKIFQLPDLKLERTKQFKVCPKGIKALGTNTLLISLQSSKGDVQKPWPLVQSTELAVKLPELEPQTWNKFLGIQETPGLPVNVRQAPDGRWIIGNVALDSEADHVESFFSAGHWQVPRPRFGGSGDQLGFNAFDEKRSATLLGEPSLAAAIKSAFTRWSNDPNHRERGATSVLRIHSEQNSEPRLIKVAWSTKADWGRFGVDNPVSVGISKHGVVTVAEGLHVLPLTVLGTADKTSDKSANGAPLQVRAAFGQFIIKSSDTLAFEVSGGKPPYTFSYGNEIDLLSLVEFTPIGNGEKVVVKFAKSQVALVNELSESLLKNSEKSAKEIVDNYQSATLTAFADILEKSPKGVLFPYEVVLTVKDANGEVVGLSHLAFLSIPENVVVKQIQDQLKAKR